MRSEDRGGETQLPNYGCVMFSDEGDELRLDSRVVGVERADENRVWQKTWSSDTEREEGRNESRAQCVCVCVWGVCEDSKDMQARIRVGKCLHFSFFLLHNLIPPSSPSVFGEHLTRVCCVLP